MAALQITQLLAGTSLASWHDPLQTPGAHIEVRSILTALGAARKPLTIKQLHQRGCCASHQRCGAVVRLLHEHGRISLTNTRKPYTYTTKL